MSTNTGDLEIGRINRKEEKALGISLTSGVLVYMSEKDVNRMAATRPATYLQDIEEIRFLIKNPDYVLYKDDTDEFYFLKEYLKNHDFVKVLVRVGHIGTPKRWMVLSVGKAKLDNLIADDIAYGFAKVN